MKQVSNFRSIKISKALTTAVLTSNFPNELQALDDAGGSGDTSDDGPCIAATPIWREQGWTLCHPVRSHAPVSLKYLGFVDSLVIPLCIVSNSRAGSTLGHASLYLRNTSTISKNIEMKNNKN